MSLKIKVVPVYSFGNGVPGVLKIFLNSVQLHTALETGHQMLIGCSLK